MSEKHSRRQGLETVRKIGRAFLDGIEAGAEVLQEEVELGKEELRAEIRRRRAEIRREAKQQQLAELVATLSAIAERKQQLVGLMQQANNPLLVEVYRLELRSLEEQEQNEAQDAGICTQAIPEPSGKLEHHQELQGTHVREGRRFVPVKGN